MITRLTTATSRPLFPFASLTHGLKGMKRLHLQVIPKGSITDVEHFDVWRGRDKLHFERVSGSNNDVHVEV